MIFRNLSAVECAWKLQAQGKEVVTIPSLELPKPLFTIFVEAVAKVIFMWAIGTTCEKNVQLPQDWFGAKDLGPGPGM